MPSSPASRITETETQPRHHSPAGEQHAKREHAPAHATKAEAIVTERTTHHGANRR